MPARITTVTTAASPARLCRKVAGDTALGHLRRLATAWLCLSTVAAFAATQNFDEWLDATDPSLVHTNAEGWVLHKAVAAVGGRWFPYPHSSPRAGWLSDFADTTNSWLRSPWLEYGLLSIGYCVSTMGTGVNHFEVQYSADGVDWQTIVSDSHSGPRSEWDSFAPTFRTGAPGYVRFLKTGQDGGAGTRLGLDDIVIEEPVYTFDPRQHGTSSRRTALTVTEIMYHPPEGSELEYVEIFNTSPLPLQLDGYRLSGQIGFTFPSNVVLQATNYVVVAANPDALVAANHGLDSDRLLGPYRGTLDNGGGTIRLRNRENAVLLEVDYDDDWPWPTQADGAGHSLMLARPHFGENDRRAWAPSQLIGGSPMRADVTLGGPLADVVINEWLTHTDSPQTDFVELYNRGAVTADVSGCVIAESPGSNVFAIPPSTRLAPGHFVSFDTNALGFALSMAGSDIYLVDTNANRVVDAVRCPAQVNGISSGRYPDGHSEIRVLDSPTPATANSGPRQRDVVINEIMYHPISGDSDDEYVELYNRGSGTVHLDDWRFTQGISFTFPGQTSIAPGAFLVVARDAARLMARYPQLNTTNTLGDYSGRLSDRGERVVLSRPDDPELPDRDFVVVDTVDYGDGDEWGRWTDGGGSSLELTDPGSDNRRAMNWAGSDETDKAPWTEIEYTGSMDYGKSDPTEIRAYLLQAGECLVDDLEIVATNGTTYFNWNFESGQGSWQFWGNHSRSTFETGTGFGGGNCMHIRASGRGDNGNDTSPWREAFWNRASAPLYQTPYDGQILIARAKVRWQAGWPHGIVGIRGYWFEAPVTMELPATLGSPGLPNSRVVPNRPPAISHVSHSPVLPAAREDVLVTCRAHDSDGVASVTLTYRVDPDPLTAAISAEMNDAGTNGDILAADGIYSATITGQDSGKLVAFAVTAADGAATNRYPLPEPEGAPERECLVRFGHTPYTNMVDSYHMWLTAANVNRWQTIAGGNSKYSNEPIAMTLIYDGCHIEYNAGGRFRGLWRGGAGDPQSSGAYSISLFESTRVLGGTEIKIDQPGQNGADRTLQKENYCFWMARQVGIPASHIHFVHVMCNGGYRGIRHDLQTPALDFCESWFDDPNPLSFKDVGWTDDPFADYRDELGRRKKSHYRWNLRRRKSDPPSDDFSPVYKLVDAFATPDDSTYFKRVRAVVDIRGWLSYFALNAAVSGWDSYGFSWCHNMYSYIPDRSGAFMFIYDLDGTIHGGTTAALFPNNASKWPVAIRFTNHPAVRREYWRLLKALAEGPFVAERTGAWIDKWHTTFLAEGVYPDSPAGIKSWIESRRGFIVSELGKIASPFEIATNGGGDFTTAATRTTLTGRAPIEASTILVNGNPVDPTFTGVTDWTLDVPVEPGPNAFTIEGRDTAGLPAGTDTITVTGTGPAVSPGSDLVINEIMYHSDDPYGDFVEIHNTSPTRTHHLGGMRLNGLDYTFPYGTFIGPAGFVVVAENLPTYAKRYGNAEVVAGEHDGSLDNGGENIQLLMPLTTNTWEVLDEVRYDDELPWPTEADGSGYSLQLIDPTRDNTRIGNWRTARPQGDRDWQRVSLTVNTDASTAGRMLAFYLEEESDLLLDDVALVKTSEQPTGANHVTNGSFETPLTPAWTASGNHFTSAITNGTAHTGAASLNIVALGAGGLGGRYPNNVRQTIVTLQPSSTYDLTFRCRRRDEVRSLVVVLSGSDLYATNRISHEQETPAAATPGAPNNTAAPLPEFPEIWINEIMPSNTASVADNTGEHEPWIEILNAGNDLVELGGEFYLSDDAANPAKWAFPSNTSLAAGSRLVVYADGEPGETAPDWPHTSWRMSSTGGVVILAREYLGDVLVLDLLDYGLIDADYSYGSYPEGDPNRRQVFHHPSPAGANCATSQPVRLRINEWMADNDNFMADPADGNYEDWFELYNYGETPVNLGGFALTDTPASSNRFTIPGGYVLPARGHLLVWADNDPEQSDGSSLHTDFALSKSGDDIALFAPDGTLVDQVTFGPQPPDTGHGRWPDGNAAVYAMAPPTPGTSNRVFAITAMSADTEGNPISWNAVSGGVYTLSRRLSLTTGDWQAVGAVTAASDTATIDSGNEIPDRVMYYRISKQGE